MKTEGDAGIRWRNVFMTGLVTFCAMYSPFLYFLWAEPSFARNTMEYTPVLPSMICLMVMDSIGMPIGILGEVLAFISTQICFTAVCWTLIYFASRRAWYWFTSAVVMVFGLSAFSHFAMFGLWSM